MTKFGKLAAGALGAYVWLASFAAQAQNAPEEGDNSPKWHAGERIQEIYSQLNLTGEQKNQLEANKQDHRAKMQMARRQMKIYREALQQELMMPQLDMPKINSTHQQIETLQDKMEDDKLSSILAVRSILTPEQFMKFDTLMHKHHPDHPDHD